MKRGRLVLVVFGVALVAAASFFLASILGLGNNSSSPSQVSTPANIPASPLLPTNSTLDWLEYHGDLSHSGFAPINVTSIQPGWTSDPLDGAVYAEPLVAGKQVLVATENNSIYSLDARTGAIHWRVNVGAPVRGDSLPCGNIDPSGITGTPAIDNSTRTLYAVAFLSKSASHVLVGINIDTGRLVMQRAIDPPGSDPLVQQERAALTVANGAVYVPFGGLYGDCGGYLGRVAAIMLDDPKRNLLTYTVPANREAGFWATPGATVDRDGYLYVTSGNGDSLTNYDHGDSVIKLSPVLKEIDTFAPSDWATLNTLDVDLGSTSPAIVGQSLIFQIGKAGVGYLVNASSMGGVGGQIFQGHVCNASFGGTAFSAPYLLVPCTDGLYMLQLGPSSFSSVWHTARFHSGPPIITGTIAWAIDVDAGVLHAFDMKTGKEVFKQDLGSVPNFTTPSTGDGRIFTAAGNHTIMSFELS